MKKGYKSKKKVAMQKLAKRKKMFRYALISFALICLILVSIFSYNSYSLWNQTFIQKNNNVISAGCFQLEVNDKNENNESTAIRLNNAYPMSESTGLSTKPYILEITNICDIPSEYYVILNEFENSNLNNNYIRYQIKEIGNTTPTLLLSQSKEYEIDESLKSEIESNQGMTINKSYEIATGKLIPTESIKYELRLWLDYETGNDAMNKLFEAGVLVISTSPQ